MFKNFIKIIFLPIIFLPNILPKNLKNKSKFLMIFLIIFGVFSCGKKSPIEKPDDYSSPDFSKISD
jgi:predicted small lipoprotein YifL